MEEELTKFSCPTLLVGPGSDAMAARKEIEMREPDLTPLGAIRQRDVNRVEKLVKEHIARGKRIVLKALEDRPNEL
jgi:DNA-binding GntR family transcriptional regulator